jgi:glyoxylase-like metal-dependent hydrolase (beta-lactamase superfamily II)
MTHRVYAIRYARRDARSGEHFYGHDPHDAPMPMDYFMWVAVSETGAVVIDAGFTPEVARERGREIVCDPAEVLGRLGVAAADVGDVVLTHLHYDHTGNLAAFPRARFWVQDAEMAFWTGRYAARGEIGAVITPGDVVDLVRLNFEHRLAFVDGDGRIAPGITVHRVGGHAPGLQVVLVETAGGPVLLASDASHFYANLEQDRPFAIVHSLPGMYGAFDRVRELAAASAPPAVVVPGHDPLVMERHPPALPGLEGLAVELVGAQ